MADIQVNLVDKGERSEQSHEIASLLRPDIQRIGTKFNANVKIVEVPPGPPVMSTIVGEIYGPDYDKQIDIANQLQDILKIQMMLLMLIGWLKPTKSNMNLSLTRKKQCCSVLYHNKFPIR